MVNDNGGMDLQTKMRLQAEKREQEWAEKEAARKQEEAERAAAERLEAERVEQEKEKFGTALAPGSRVTTKVIPTHSGHSEISVTKNEKKQGKTRVYRDNPSDNKKEKESSPPDSEQSKSCCVIL